MILIVHHPLLIKKRRGGGGGGGGEGGVSLRQNSEISLTEAGQRILIHSKKIHRRFYEIPWRTLVEFLREQGENSANFVLSFLLHSTIHQKIIQTLLAQCQMNYFWKDSSRSFLILLGNNKNKQFLIL